MGVCVCVFFLQLLLRIAHGKNMSSGECFAVRRCGLFDHFVHHFQRVFSGFFAGYTPPKTNMAPEDLKDMSMGKPFVWRVYVSFHRV